MSTVPGNTERPRRITVDPEGPLLVEGPVEVVGADGTTAVSDRFTVALCTCRRSSIPPWCDTSHRARTRPAQRQADGEGNAAAGSGEPR